MKTRSIVGIVVAATAMAIPGGMAFSDTSRYRHLEVDPATVDCSTFETGGARQCLEVADEVYQLVQLLFQQLGDGDFATALTETTPNSLMFYPDGSIRYGIDGLNTRTAALLGSSDFTFLGAAGSHRYKPLDDKVVVFVGQADFTIQDNEHGGEIRTVTFYQTEVFRRNQRMARGWEQISEQLAYPSPLLGGDM